MAIVIKEIDVRTTIEQQETVADAAREVIKRRIQEEIQQNIEKQIAERERLYNERGRER